MLYLHIGTVKTGTTFLQRVFHENSDVFQRNGLSYLPVFPDDLHLPRYANAKFLYDRSLEQTAHDFMRSDRSAKMLVSEEGIFGYADLLQHPVFRDLPKKIIVYVRPTAEVLSAWAAEFCKPYNVVMFPCDESFHATGRRILSVDEALDVASHEYAVSLGRFMNVVDEIGRENVIVRPYERASFVGHDLLTDLLTAMEIDADAIRADPDFREPGLTNITPNRKFCDVSHVVWQNLGRPSELIDYHHDLVEAVAATCASGDTRSVVETLTDTQIEWLSHRFSHFESFLSRGFLGGKPLFQNRYPACHGIEREPYRPLNRREADLATELVRMRRAD